MIVLDTSVLSHVFRRPSRHAAESEVVKRYTELIDDEVPLVVPGIVYQELLSGVRDDLQFARLRRVLEGFPMILAGSTEHLEAARLVNGLRRHGLAVSAVDALIASIAMQRNAFLFTTDADFQRIAQFAPLRLLQM